MAVRRVSRKFVPVKYTSLGDGGEMYPMELTANRDNMFIKASPDDWRHNMVTMEGCRYDFIHLLRDAVDYQRYLLEIIRDRSTRAMVQAKLDQYLAMRDFVEDSRNPVREAKPVEYSLNVR